MKIACVTVTAFIAHSQSLKDKRSVVKRLCAELHRIYGASVCEDHLQEDRQWLGLGIAVACADKTMAEKRAQRITDALYDDLLLTRLTVETEIL